MAGTVLNALIPLSGQAPDLAGSLGKGVALGNALFGNQITPYQQRVLDLKQQELSQQSQSPQLSPYQSLALQLRQRELDDRQAARAAPQPVNAVEGIRRKLANGEPLSPGEQRVYDDATNMSVFDRLLLGQQGNGPGQPTPPAAPGPTSQAPLSFEPNPASRRIGGLYQLPNGRTARWSQDGRTVGWELVN